MSARPPITHMPAERPRCPLCARPLKPWTRDTTDAGGHVTGRTWAGWHAYGGLFDRLQCALEFAVRSHRGGYRVQT